MGTLILTITATYLIILSLKLGYEAGKRATGRKQTIERA